jgi:hypothetical protein
MQHVYFRVTASQSLGLQVVVTMIIKITVFRFVIHLKMEAVDCSEKLVHIYQIACHMLGESNGCINSSYKYMKYYFEHTVCGFETL